MCIGFLLLANLIGVWAGGGGSSITLMKSEYVIGHAAIVGVFNDETRFEASSSDRVALYPAEQDFQDGHVCLHEPAAWLYLGERGGLPLWPMKQATVFFHLVDLVSVRPGKHTVRYLYNRGCWQIAPPGVNITFLTAEQAKQSDRVAKVVNAIEAAKNELTAASAPTPSFVTTDARVYILDSDNLVVTVFNNESQFPATQMDHIRIDPASTENPIGRDAEPIILLYLDGGKWFPNSAIARARFSFSTRDDKLFNRPRGLYTVRYVTKLADGRRREIAPPVNISFVESLAEKRAIEDAMAAGTWWGFDHYKFTATIPMLDNDEEEAEEEAEEAEPSPRKLVLDYQYVTVHDKVDDGLPDESCYHDDEDHDQDEIRVRNAPAIVPRPSFVSTNKSVYRIGVDDLYITTFNSESLFQASRFDYVIVHPASMEYTEYGTSAVAAEPIIKIYLNGLAIPASVAIIHARIVLWRGNKLLAALTPGLYTVRYIRGLDRGQEIAPAVNITLVEATPPVPLHSFISLSKTVCEIGVDAMTIAVFNNKSDTPSRARDRIAFYRVTEHERLELADTFFLNGQHHQPEEATDRALVILPQASFTCFTPGPYVVRYVSHFTTMAFAEANMTFVASNVPGIVREPRLPRYETTAAALSKSYIKTQLPIHYIDSGFVIEVFHDETVYPSTPGDHIVIHHASRDTCLRTIHHEAVATGQPHRWGASSSLTLYAENVRGVLPGLYTIRFLRKDGTEEIAPPINITFTDVQAEMDDAVQQWELAQERLISRSYVRPSKQVYVISDKDLEVEVFNDEKLFPRTPDDRVTAHLVEAVSGKKEWRPICKHPALKTRLGCSISRPEGCQVGENNEDVRLNRQYVTSLVDRTHARVRFSHEELRWIEPGIYAIRFVRGDCQQDSCQDIAPPVNITFVASAASSPVELVAHSFTESFASARMTPECFFLLMAVVIMVFFAVVLILAMSAP